MNCQRLEIVVYQYVYKFENKQQAFYLEMHFVNR